MRTGAAAGAAVLALVGAPGLTACSDAADAEPGPRVDWIDETMDAIASQRGAEPAYVEISATLEHVDAIVRDAPGTPDDPAGSRAVLYRYDGELAGPIEPRDDARETFSADEVTIDPDGIFDSLRDELGEPVIIDLAIRVEGGAPVIDATVAGDQGGILLVLLNAEGDVLGLQAT